MSDLTETERCHLLSIRNQLSYATSLWSAEIATLDRLLATTPRKEVATEPVAERVREVVRAAVAQAFEAYDHGHNANRAEMIDHAARRAAGQLAATGLTVKG